MNMPTNQRRGQDSYPVGFHPENEDLEIDPSLQEPSFNSSLDVGRRWHSLRRRCYHEQRSQNFSFTVISYNILADGLLHANSNLYCGVEQWIKDWEYRRRNLIHEILHYKADVSLKYTHVIQFLVFNIIQARFELDFLIG